MAPSQPDAPPPSPPRPEDRKTGALAVLKLMLGALFMIGRKQTWEAGGIGHRLTPQQIILGAIAGGIVVVGALILIVRIALTLAGAS